MSSCAFTTVPGAKLHALTATEALAMIRDETITVVQYAQALLDRIEERDKIVRAWTYLDKAYVLSQARALDKIPRSERGSLHGVSVALKDVMDTKDMPTQYGFASFQDFRPHVDAALVSTLRNAGALILGKTTTTEFTILNSGPGNSQDIGPVPYTTNPHDHARTPGGSSAGSAAAVADFQVALGFGTQNGGSVIRPASYCGVFAMKPTLQAIPTVGVKVVSHSIDTVGFFTRSLEDLQLVADVFNFPRNNDAARQLVPKPRVAFVQTPMWHAAGAGTIAAMSKAANILEDHGWGVHEVKLPKDFPGADTLLEIHNRIVHAEFQTGLLMHYREDKAKRIDPIIQAIIESAAKGTLRQTDDAMSTYAHLRCEFDQFAADFDFVITPSAQDIAPLGLVDMGSSVFNFLWTGLYASTINIPAFTGDQGLPVGLSVVAGRFQDQYLLRACQTLSQVLMSEGGWNIRKPLSGIDCE